MKRIGINRLLSWACAFIVVTLVLTAQVVMASDGSSSWRPAYDLAMRWINFGIIVFLIFKYARKPLVNFFREKSEDVKKDIEAIESEKEEIQEKVDEILKDRDHSQERLEKVKERIIAQGKIKKQSIIDNAQRESKILLESARRKIDNQILSAREGVRAELIDQAIEMAMQKLPDEIEETDDKKLYERYIKSTQLLSGV